MRPAWAPTIGCKSRAGAGERLPLPEGSGARGDAGSEGSRRQTPGPRYTNPFGGRAGRAMLQNKPKPKATKGRCGKHGRMHGGKVSVLTRGGLSARRREPTTRAARRG